VPELGRQVVEVDEDGGDEDPARDFGRAPGGQQRAERQVRGLVEDADGDAVAPGERAQRVGQQRCGGEP
jgi:hypothetical protein